MAIAGVTLLAAAVCDRALGDADPASDVLLGENVFYPYSPQVTAKLQATLNGEVTAARRAHLPLKVALVAAPLDLGAIPTFFGKPRQYAAFLDQEVPLLVVMRNGYGTAGLTPGPASAVAALSAPPSGTPNGLAQAAISAVPKLAAASGHPLSPISRAAGGGSGPALPLAILAAVCALLAAGIIVWRTRRAPSGRRRR
jgi:hypothetical protein